MSRAAKPPPQLAPVAPIPPRSNRDTIGDQVMQVLGCKLTDLAEQLYVAHLRQRVRDEFRGDAIANRFREVLARSPEASSLLRGFLDLIEDESARALCIAVVERDCACPGKDQPCSHALDDAAKAMRTSRPGKPGKRDGYFESKTPPANGNVTVDEMKRRVKDGESTK